MLKAGLIGLGKQNLNDHLETILASKDIKLTLVCDPSETAFQSFSALHPELKNVLLLKDYRKISHQTVDFVIVSVPHDQYLPIVKFLCAKHIPFMKEKPLARNLSEARRILSIPDIEKYCFICTQRRYNPFYKQAYRQLKKIGKPFLFNATYKLAIADPASGWRGDKSCAGGGCLLDMGYHVIDQLNWWFGPPNYISASISALAKKTKRDYAEDSASLHFRYKSGLHGTLVLSRSAGEKDEHYELDSQNGHLLGNKKNLVVKNKNGDIVTQLSADNDKDSLNNQLHFFLTNLSHHRNFAPILERNLANMQLIDRAYKSAHEKI